MQPPAPAAGLLRRAPWQPQLLPCLVAALTPGWQHCPTGVEVVLLTLAGTRAAGQGVWAQLMGGWPPQQRHLRQEGGGVEIPPGSEARVYLVRRGCALACACVCV